MQVKLKNKDGTMHDVDVSSLIITLGNGETLEIADEKTSRPATIPEGVIVWRGKMPEEGASLEELKMSTCGLGMYPLASNMLHLFPYTFSK